MPRQVGSESTADTGMRLPYRCSSTLETWTTVNEVAPSFHRSASAAIPSRPSWAAKTAAISSARRSSVMPRSAGPGAAGLGSARPSVPRLPPAPNSGAAVPPPFSSAARSSFPLEVAGKTSQNRTTFGTMCAGRVSATKARSSAPVTGADAITKPCSRSASAKATASLTAGCSRNRCSTSPSSTRKPRSLTWVSWRPRKVRFPSGRYAARSPVR